MQCKYIINDDQQCKIRTLNPVGYCHRHLHKVNLYKFPKPKSCPVCFERVHQCRKPLSCGHWIHKSCVRKSGKAECPLCRQNLPEIEIPEDSEYELFDIPQDALVLAVIAYQLYSHIISPNQRILGLDHFVSGVINDTIPIDHPSHNSIMAFLYGEALGLLFDPYTWV